MANILIIDDNREISEVIALILSMDNHLVETIENSKGLTAVLARFKPDIIIIDVFLSGEDGRKVCSSIKDTHNDIAIILMSASNITLKNFEDYCANGVISKPFDINDLTNKVNDVLSLHKTDSERQVN